METDDGAAVIYVVTNTGGYVMGAFTARKDCVDYLNERNPTLLDIMQVSIMKGGDNKEQVWARDFMEKEA